MKSTNTRRTKYLARIGWIITSVVLFVAIILVAGAIYQASATNLDRTAYVREDNLISVNGIDMYIQCEGEGSPTVIFESGAGTPALTWWEIREGINQNVRTCVYDRQSIGWSEYTGQTPTPEHVAQTLHALLTSAGESAPYILVGHSMGGIYVREYTKRHPDKVVGMVLIDSSHEQQQVRFPAEFGALSDAEMPILQVCRVIAPFGMVRLLNLGTQNSVFAEDSPVYAENLAIFYQSNYCAGVSADIAGITTLDTTAPPASLGDLPLVVLTAGVPISTNADSLPQAFSQETLQAVDEVWLELQAELAALSSNSTWTVVEDATHYVHFDNPQIVIEAIDHILKQAAMS